MENSQLHKIFFAGSVAVIGASANETKRGYRVIETLLREKYEGKIYPVNPKLNSILGIRCYHSITEVREDIDIALITTAADTIPVILEECGKKNVKGVVIISGGFGELGAKGRQKEKEISAIAKKYNIRIIGPNTSGMISLHNKLNLVGIQDVPRGNIALLSQSGNIALHIITEAGLRSNVGFSHYVGVGNEADLKFHEYLKYFEDDPATRAIVMYVEGMREGRSFLQQAYQTTRKKPIILLKSGRSVTGMRSAGSHTGSLAGISEVSRTAFRRAGIVTIDNLDELFPVTEALSILPPIHKNRVAILADGGGHATIASDMLSDYGIEIPQLGEKTQKRLAEILPANASLKNPVDVAGGTDENPSIFADCAKIILNDPSVDGLIIVGLFGGYSIRFADKLRYMEEDAAHQMGKLVKKIGKPIILQSLYALKNTHSLGLLRYYGIPVYESLGIACKCLASLSQYGKYLNHTQKRPVHFVFNWKQRAKTECIEIIEKAKSEGRRSLLETEAKRIFFLHKAPVYEEDIAASADHAVKLAKKIGGKVVLKIVSQDILHKSDAGGVKVNLETEDEIRTAFDKIISNVKDYNPGADIKGCLVSPMSDKGVEIIIGTKIDDQFGPVIMVGLGGILVEVLKDVAFRVLPITRTSAKGMLSEIKSAPILDGVRGEQPVDKKAILDLLLVVSEIVESYPDIQEIDLNPVIARNDGISIVDARIILKEGEFKSE
ncbi:MAG: acyl-CoA synthetase [Spirochaetae bacterium HGW-Spirochaetae-5]|nr:MAG: acyl-CoA synthetase [Spirochaetae bacterium HGW-Spirochaetae-5]